MAFPSPCCPESHESSWKETQTAKKYNNSNNTFKVINFFIDFLRGTKNTKCNSQVSGLQLKYSKKKFLLSIAIIYSGMEIEN